ncbi:alpha/beta fold hydrolase [Streptomyces sp. NPDC058701]|uniref:alpha/beta fold hydrolase n=1 Tax=Streptomyces sp. NPDC058701 TaxID=3346608 RepID=UPI0036631E3C
MTLAHDVAGSGPTVVLLHSTVCDRRMWDPQIPALVDAGHRVVRCDLRGFGQSPVPAGPYDDARDVTDLLDLLGVERAALVAASGGGRVALEIAARRPRGVTSLALLCTALAGHEPGAELRAFGAREDALIEAGDVAGATALNVDTWLGPEADGATREKVRRMQGHAFAVQLAAAEREGSGGQEGKEEAADGNGGGDGAGSRPAGTELSAITAPVLLVSGRYDLPDFRAIAVRLADELPDARHLELPWAGHLPSMERPDAVNALLVDFLRGPAAGQGAV